tara:strand:- start:4734 stop:5357 length:624 start_codon:yes stop_codon:yes gene_type:complete
MRVVTAFLLCVLCLSVQAQDERYYRSIFSGDLFSSEKEGFYHKIAVRSKKYMLDINRDGKEDAIQTLKRDGVDFFRVLDEYGRVKFESKLNPKGLNSSIFRVSFKAISKTIDVLILHYYEGDTEAAIFEGSARLYFATIINRDLGNIKFQKGPYFWTEREGVVGKYWNRRYIVNTLDYNNDGFREISTTYNKNNRVFMYKDEQWVTL